MSLLQRITIDPHQFGGRPCIRGLNIKVKDVLDYLANGGEEADMLKHFPNLEPDDIKAALEFAFSNAEQVNP